MIAVVELRQRHDVVHEPDAVRLRGFEALGGEEIAPRLARADRFDTYGEIVAGMRPSLLSLNAKVASTAAIAMSQQATRPTPPPNAAPCTRATVGFGSSFSVRSISREARGIGEVLARGCSPPSSSSS